MVGRSASSPAGARIARAHAVDAGASPSDTTSLVLLALTLGGVDERGLVAWCRAPRGAMRQLSWDALPFLLEVFGRHGSSAARAAEVRARAEELVGRGRAAGLIPIPCPRLPPYPELLATVCHPPLLLWVRGDPAVLSTPAVAIVGARVASVAALDVARNLGRELAARGLTVVSGLARGIDAAAHAGALETGKTIAVLGGGVDVVYPPEHRGLADRIAHAGAVISEYPPGTPSRQSHFPRRNRIVSGLAPGVVIVEAGEKSGALITAREALEQGREVMVVPGPVASGRNRGGHALLKDGAALVENADDVIAVLDATMFSVRPKRSATGVLRDTGEAPDPQLPRDLASQSARGANSSPVHPDRRPGPPETWLTGEELDLDDLQGLVEKESPGLLAALLEWELAGLVARTPAGRFVRLSR